MTVDRRREETLRSNSVIEKTNTKPGQAKSSQAEALFSIPS